MADPAVPLSQDTRWIVTTIIALWGAGLATYREFVSMRPVARVRLSRGVVLMPMFVAGEEPLREDSFTVLIENRGKADLTFGRECCSVEIRNDDVIGVGEVRSSQPNLPAMIGPGQSISITIGAAVFLDYMKRQKALKPPYNVRALVSDAIGRQFKSKWLTVAEAKKT